MQVNERHSRAFGIERSVRQGCPLSLLRYVLALEPLLRKLRDEGTNPALRGVYFAGSLTARVSKFTDDITVIVSRHLDIKAVKKAVGKYEWIAGAKVNFDKSESLRLGAWRGKRYPFMALPQEWRNHTHSRGVVRARLQIGAKLVGSTS